MSKELDSQLPGRQDTWNTGLITMVSEKIDNGNTLISDDMITWILETSAGARETHTTHRYCCSVIEYIFGN